MFEDASFFFVGERERGKMFFPSSSSNDAHPRYLRMRDRESRLSFFFLFLSVCFLSASAMRETSSDGRLFSVLRLKG
jgi:hypothetical protein